jgi:hypothetical protein
VRERALACRLAEPQAGTVVRTVRTGGHANSLGAPSGLCKRAPVGRGGPLVRKLRLQVGFEARIRRLLQMTRTYSILN